MSRKITCQKIRLIQLKAAIVLLKMTKKAKQDCKKATGVEQ